MYCKCLWISMTFLLIETSLHGQVVTMADHDIGNVRFSVSDGGRFGWDDLDKTNGSGFVYPISGVDHLWEGALVVGCDPVHVSHCARSTPSGPVATDWRRRPGGDIVIHTPGIVSDQDGWSKYADTSAPNPIGIEVDQRSFAYGIPEYDDFVIVELTLRNTGIGPSSDIENLHVGLYMDWDVQPYYGTALNSAAVDTSHDVGYIWSTTSDIHCGVHVLTDLGVTSFDLINNQDGSYEFTREEFWHSLSDGIQDYSGSNEDWSYVISTGPFVLLAGESVTIAFAVLAGDNYPDLLTNLFASREIYHRQFDIVTVKTAPDTNSIPQGGALGIHAAATNNTGEMLRIEGWTEVTFPDGRYVSPVMTGEELDLDPEETMVKRIEHDIPPDAPIGGVCTYCVSVGEFPDFVYDQDCFEFEIISKSE